MKTLPALPPSIPSHRSARAVLSRPVHATAPVAATKPVRAEGYDGTTPAARTAPPTPAPARDFDDAKDLKAALAGDVEMLARAAAIAFPDGVKPGTRLLVSHVTKNENGFSATIERGRWFLRSDDDWGRVELDARGRPHRFQSADDVKAALATPAFADAMHRAAFGGPLPEGVRLAHERVVPLLAGGYGMMLEARRDDDLIARTAVGMSASGEVRMVAAVG